MEGNQKNYWGQSNLNSICFGVNTDMEHNLKEFQSSQLTRGFNTNISLSQPPFYLDSYRLRSDNMLSIEGDQVVPSPVRTSIFGGHQKEAKPLPPLPDPEELMSDEAADNEVEFFTSDRQRLLPKSCPKTICRASNKDSGKVNHAYQENSSRETRAGSFAGFGPSGDDRVVNPGNPTGLKNWSFVLQREDNQHEQPDINDAFGGQQLDQVHSSRNRFSCSDLPSQAQNNFTSSQLVKPQIPPRIPIPSKASIFSKTSTEDDKPPKIPPRIPLVPPCPPRTPSPKSLPIYINGVMPVTQSFAANPNYVSKALQRQQNERATPAVQFSPCIVPIMKDGKQASNTHYILLAPDRPTRTHVQERLLSEPNRKANASVKLKW